MTENSENHAYLPYAHSKLKMHTPLKGVHKLAKWCVIERYKSIHRLTTSHLMASTKARKAAFHKASQAFEQKNKDSNFVSKFESLFGAADRT